MGVKGLWDVLKPLGQPINLESLRGKVLAVDISFWLHHAKYVSDVKGISEHKAAVELVYRRVLKLLHFGVRPVFVFDGPEASIFKLPTLNERRKQREHQATEKARRSRNSSLKTLARKALAVQLARDEGKKKGRSANLATECNGDDDVDKDATDESSTSASSTQNIPTVSISDDNNGMDEEADDLGALPWLLHHLPDGCDERHKSVNIVFSGADHAHVVIRSDKGAINETGERGGFVDNEERRRGAIERIRRLAALDQVRQLRQNQQARCELVASKLLVHEDEHRLSSSDDEQFEEVPEVDPHLLVTRSISDTREPSPSPSQEEPNDERRYTVDKWVARKETDNARAPGGEIAERCRELLTYFGVPFVDSPAEAEAQCVNLEINNLTDGTITDDSDVWAFGGRAVYRHVFERKKSALEYRSEDVSETFGLRRLHFVALAVILGCDFTPGVVNVGAVSALEIISTFISNGKTELSKEKLIKQLARFRRWWENNHVQEGKPEAPETNATKRRLRTLNCIFPSSFPDRQVFDIFVKPNVRKIENGEKPAFEWSQPDVGNLRRLLAEEFDDMKRVDVELADLRRRLRPPDPSQSKLTSYFVSTKRRPTCAEVLETTGSKRLKKACEKLKRSS